MTYESSLLTPPVCAGLAGWNFGTTPRSMQTKLRLALGSGFPLFFLASALRKFFFSNFGESPQGSTGPNCREQVVCEGRGWAKAAGDMDSTWLPLKKAASGVMCRMFVIRAASCTCLFWMRRCPEAATCQPKPFCVPLLSLNKCDFPRRAPKTHFVHFRAEKMRLSSRSCGSARKIGFLVPRIHHARR